MESSNPALKNFQDRISSPKAENVSSEPERQTSFHQIGGNVTTLVNYALTGLHFNPSRGILLIYANYIVWVKGRNLSSVFADLQAQRVKELKAETERHLSNPNTDKPVITNIQVMLNNLAAAQYYSIDDMFNDIEATAATGQS